MKIQNCTFAVLLVFTVVSCTGLAPNPDSSGVGGALQSYEPILVNGSTQAVDPLLVTERSMMEPELEVAEARLDELAEWLELEDVDSYKRRWSWGFAPSEGAYDYESRLMGNSCGFPDMPPEEGAVTTIYDFDRSQRTFMFKTVLDDWVVVDKPCRLIGRAFACEEDAQVVDASEYGPFDAVLTITDEMYGIWTSRESFDTGTWQTVSCVGADCLDFFMLEEGECHAWSLGSYSHTA